MLDRVLTVIREHYLFAPGATVLVAVSGGADSVALLDILTRLAELRPRLVVAHLNHRLRGAEADGDERFVQELAARYGLPVVTMGVDVAALARRERLSLEEAGREARYAFFAEVAATYGACVTALGHHADDQAETLLMRLLRGAGGSGLCAMAPRSADGKYVRPLLGISRTEIEAYVAARSLSFRHDESNDDTRFLRNRIRHELLPLLATYNPGVSRRLAATAAALGEDEAVLVALTLEAFSRHAKAADGNVLLTAQGLLAEPKGVRLRLYRHAILQIRGDLRLITSHHLLEIDRLLFAAKPQLSLDLPGNLRVARSYGEISFRTGGPEASCAAELVVTGPGAWPLPGGGSLNVTTEAATSVASSRLRACFDLDKAPFPWHVRTFRPGDRLSPSGMTGSKKVKKLFIDEKLPDSWRRRIPLVFSGGNLIWVGGVRTGSGAGVESGTRVVATAEILDFTPDIT